MNKDNLLLLQYELSVEACDYGCGKDSVSFFVYKGCPLHYPLLGDEDRTQDPVNVDE